MGTIERIIFIIIVLVIGANYRWFWYHTQFWIKDKAARRPYTFMMRDFYHDSPIIVCFALVYAGFALGAWLVPFDHMLLFSGGLLIAHLFWGGSYIHDQQEEPEYHPDATIELTDKGKALTEKK